MKKKLTKVGVLVLAVVVSVGMMASCGSTSKSKSDNAVVVAVDADYNNLNPCAQVPSGRQSTAYSLKHCEAGCI